ncbi:MAG: DUF3500 domain-containing protein [Verrucomicrobia bacterium]|nr:DUF3500 domain-containing protein [Verrucomicrobiota bacterium]
MTLWRPFLVYAGLILAWNLPSPAGPADDAQHWISQLNADERRQALLKWSDPERRHIGWMPGVRAGLPLKGMRPEVQTAFWDLLKSQLSPGGVDAIQTVLGRERILQRIQDAPEFRDPTRYYVAIFGNPGYGPWSVRFEGHHLSLNLTYLGDQVISGTPLFVGSNPEPFDESGQPKVFLTPLLEEAAAVGKNLRSGAARTGQKVGLLGPDDQKRVREILDFYYQFYPGPVRDRLAQDLDARLKQAVFRYDESGIEINGAGLHYYLQRQGDLHYHSLLRDERMDFGVNRLTPPAAAPPAQ